MWQRYDEVCELNAKVLSIGLISTEDGAARHLDPEHGDYRDRHFVMIDESHNFRSSETYRSPSNLQASPINQPPRRIRPPAY